jgi:hypothetical protein
MKVCFLTQTATDISPFYKEFFKGHDLFFITFKTPNPNAIGFFPKSTWSDGRNALWEKVKDKYDYYVFLDDDISFFSLEPVVMASALASSAWLTMRRKSLREAYEPATSSRFIGQLLHYLKEYKPEVAAVMDKGGDAFGDLALRAMRKNSFVMRLGYFDAQFTVFSNYAATKLLPYDTKVSGWWSSQIPIYLYAYHVFGARAITLTELAVQNTNPNGAYRPGYDGYQDCTQMLSEISQATGKDYSQLAGGTTAQPVDPRYGAELMQQQIPKPSDTEDYYNRSLAGLEKILHPHLKP